MTGPPKYLKLHDSGLLGVAADFDWTDESLFWQITKVDGGYTLKHTSSGLYFSPTNRSIGGVDRIGTTTTPSVYSITYTGDETPTQSNTTKALSFYRINSSAANDMQIRARTFGDDWFWGSGTLTRADMIFTFGEVTGLVPTGISSMNNEQLKMNNDGTVYDLQGRRIQGQLDHLPKGLYIVDGKKVLNK